MSAGTRSRAMTATAPASSAIFACSGVTTSMITPPLSMSARPRLTPPVPVVVAGSGVVTGASGVRARRRHRDRTALPGGRTVTPCTPPASVDGERDGAGLEGGGVGEQLGELVGMDDVEGHRELARRPPAVTAHGAGPV